MPTTSRMWLRGRTGAATIAALSALALSAGGAYALRIVEVRHGSGSGAPQPGITEAPNGHTDLRWALFTFSDRSSAGSYQCSLDGSAFRGCPRRVVYGLVEGTSSATLGCRAPRSGANGSKQAAKRRRRAARRCQAAHGKRLSGGGRGGSHRKATTRVCGQEPSTGKPNSARPASAKHSHCQRAYIEGVGRLLSYGGHTFRVRFRATSGRLSKVTTYRWTILTKAQLEAFQRGTGATGATGAAGSGSTGTTGSTGSTGSNGGGSSPAPIVRTKGFSISGQPEGMLYPGGPALPIPLRLLNPNPLPIYITSLTVSVVASPTGCSAEENLRITQSTVSPSNPILVPASGSVMLPLGAASAPTIQFLDLPVNQDACESATFPLSYSGSAHS